MKKVANVPSSVQRRLQQRSQKDGSVVKRKRRAPMSALQRQLKTIEQQNARMGGPTSGGQRLRHASILFEEKDAARLDLDDIRSLALTGIRELQRVDDAFVQLEVELFPNDKFLVEHFDRSLLTRPENDAIDDLLYRAMLVLTPFLERPASHQLLEWLIRAYRINELSLEALFAGILPWHDTPVFVRCVQCCYFQHNDKWGFLFEPVKQQASAVTREFLAKRCLVDSSLLDTTVLSALKWLSAHSPHESDDSHNHNRDHNSTEQQDNDDDRGGKQATMLYASFAAALMLQYVQLMDADDKNGNRFRGLQAMCQGLARLPCHDVQVAAYTAFAALLAKFAPVLHNLDDILRSFMQDAVLHAVPKSPPLLTQMEQLFHP
jgi:hypothetical protein